MFAFFLVADPHKLSGQSERMHFLFLNCLIREFHHKNKKRYTQYCLCPVLWCIQMCAFDCFENKQSGANKTMGGCHKLCLKVVSYHLIPRTLLYWNSYFIRHCIVNRSKMMSSNPLNQYGTACYTMNITDPVNVSSLHIIAKPQILQPLNY